MLKYYVDSGVLDRAVAVATASSTVGLLKTPERFPGRRGLDRGVVVLPLDFPAYVEVHGVDAREPAAVAHLFEEYLENGGFPKAINRHPDAVDAVRDAVVSETYRHGRSPQLLKDILGAVLEKVPSPMPYHAVAQEVGVSHNTVREYVEFLADIYAVGVAYLISGGKPQTRREKKIFFRAPPIPRRGSLDLAEGRRGGDAGAGGAGTPAQKVRGGLLLQKQGGDRRGGGALQDRGEKREAQEGLPKRRGGAKA